jgi:hypothetical protein
LVTKRRGEYSARVKSALLTSGSGYSYWPTAVANDFKGPSGKGRQLRKGNPTDTLSNAMQVFGPANPKDHNSAGNPREWCGKLNPRWVETLMGLPIGWVMPSCMAPVTIEQTNFDSSETESSLLPQSELFTS